MEILLLSVTVISLVVAFIMSVAAWRLSRDARARSAARVAALAAAATRDHDAVPARRLEQASERRAAEPEVVVTRAADAAFEWDAVAVNESRQAPWAPARVSAFPAEAATDRRAADSPDKRPAKVTPAAEPAPMSEGFLGSAAAGRASGGPQRGLAIAACVLFVVIVTGGYFTLYGGSSGSVSAAAGVTAGTAPLELVSLRHERRGGRLAITGLVRNPQGGAAVDRLTAVVFLFDQQSAFVTSARADVDFRTLAPGDESPFVIGVEAPSNVARYRVSFRNEAGVVPHVDRRSQEPIARELP